MQVEIEIDWKIIVYGLLFVAGFVLPWYFNLQAMNDEGGPLNFFTMGFVNPVASSLTVDLLIGASAVAVFIVAEARRLGMPHWWIYLVLTGLVAFAFSVPLFLLMRERHLPPF